MSTLEQLQIWWLVQTLTSTVASSPTLLSLQYVWTVEGLLESMDHTALCCTEYGVLTPCNPLPEPYPVNAVHPPLVAFYLRGRPQEPGP
jgi:hypothetical protein